MIGIFDRIGNWLRSNGSTQSAAAQTPAPPPPLSVTSLAPLSIQCSRPRDEAELLDDLFRATVAYRKSTQYRELLDYMARFRRYSAYNCFLVRLQKPSVGYVATPGDWWREFERTVKADARPLVILRPFGPVMFVFDIADTAGKEPPPDLMNPFDAKGELDPLIWNRTVRNCERDSIWVTGKEMPVVSAGSARSIPPQDGVARRFEVAYNTKQHTAEAYVTLVHELAHVYCGHTGAHPRNKWPDRRDRPKDVKEFEAESISYIVCSRLGLMTTAPQYLASYLGLNDEVPPIDIHRVLVVASRIEEMGRSERDNQKRVRVIMEGAAPSIPQVARARLREGVITTFRNGQKWTLRNGLAVKLGASLETIADDAQRLGAPR